MKKAKASPSPSPSPSPAVSAAPLAISELENVTANSDLEVRAHINGNLMPVYILQKCSILKQVATCADYLVLNCANGTCNGVNAAASITVKMMSSPDQEIDVVDTSEKAFGNCDYMQITGYADSNKNGASNMESSISAYTSGC
jgi:hypothetical protein